MVKITDCARLPLTQIKGSMQQRFAKSEEYCDKLFQNIIDDFECGDDVHVIKIKDSFNKVLNKYINIVFEKTNAGESPSAGTISLHGDNRICGYSLTLPMDNKNTISLFSTTSLMHEVRHIFDYLTNPKILTRQVGYKKSVPETILFKTVLTADKDFNKKELTSWLDHCFGPKDIYNRINFLQSCRHYFLTEKNAYGRELYYLQKFITEKKHLDFSLLLHPKNEFSHEINRFNDFLNRFNIDGKIEALNEELAKAIKTVRDDHKAQLELQAKLLAEGELD